MTRRRLLSIVAAVLLTAFGTVVLVAYVNSAENRARQDMELVAVLVVNERIPQGTPAREITPEQARREEWPSYTRAENAVERLDALGNRVAATDLMPGEQLLTSDFMPPERTPQTGGQRTDETKQVITIALERQRAAGGNISAGQEVGVIMSFDGAASSDEEEAPAEGAEPRTRLVLAPIMVSAVEGATPQTGADPGTPVMVSLEVDASQSERIAFAAEFGRIWLTLQNEGTSNAGGQDRTLDNILEDPEVGS